MRPRILVQNLVCPYIEILLSRILFTVYYTVNKDRRVIPIIFFLKMHAYTLAAPL